MAFNEQSRRHGDTLSKERLGNTPKDLMEMMRQYPDPIQKLIAQRTQHIQGTDGCTGGCPWCSFDVIRKIKEGFTMDSCVEYIKENRDYLPPSLAWYWATDPLDIAGLRTGEAAPGGSATETYDYADFLDAVLTHTPMNVHVHTSTSVPEGTEGVLERALEVTYRHWVRGRNDPFRISLRPERHQAIQQVFDTLRAKKLSPLFLQRVGIEGRDENTRTIQYLGKFINHAKRDPYHSTDALSVACYDGCLIRPSGISTISLEAVTSQSPFGQTYAALDPNAETFELPRYVQIDPYTPEGISKNIVYGLFPAQLLPEVIVDTFDRDGTVQNTTTIHSIRRDLQAMIQLSNGLWKVTQEPRDILRMHRDGITTRLNEYMIQAQLRRLFGLMNAKDNCDDQEALDLFKAMSAGVLSVRDEILRKLQ